MVQKQIQLEKWKCSHEPQPKNIAMVKTLTERLATTFPAPVHSLLPPGVPKLVAQMYAVATVPVAVPAKKVQSKSTKTPSVAELALQAAIESALTKFDHLHTFFERGERGAIAALLLAEVTADLKLEKGAAKQAIGAVNKRIGMEFGQWKKKQGH